MTTEKSIRLLTSSIAVLGIVKPVTLNVSKALEEAPYSEETLLLALHLLLPVVGKVSTILFI